MIVEVVDQNGAVVPAAKVAVLNSATGDQRDGVSGTEGSVTFSGLSLTGTYTVSISKDGFGGEERKNITLRSMVSALRKEAFDCCQSTKKV